MPALFLLTCLIIGCTADIPQDASDATCSQKDGQGCPGKTSEYAEDDAAMSFLQTQMKVAPLEGLPQAVLVEKSEAVLVEGYSEEELEQTEEDELFPEDLVLVEGTLADCAAKVARLDKLNGQSLLTGAGTDDLFPPKEISIAPPWTACGDTAQGETKYCSDYDNWKTFRAVAQNTGREYSMIATGGIRFSDIDQGSLGNCYFLAALVSIVYTNPKIIQNMFVERENWEYGVFKTRWLVAGEESIIVVDSMIPAAEKGDTFFTHASPTGAWWPVVLAKTWAKIFGSFHAVEQGNPADVVTAITQSPSKTFKPRKMTDEAIWKVLIKCTTKKLPMYALTNNRAKYGLAKGHAYAILEAYTHAVHGDVVKCYNPWGKDYDPRDYTGSIPNDVTINGQEHGVFTIALGEFRGAFGTFNFNYVEDGYKATALSGLSPGKSAIDLSVSQPGKFWVSIVWPLQRMVEGCGQTYPTIRLSGALTTEPGNSLGKWQRWAAASGRRDYKFPGTTAGTYDVTVDLQFQNSYLKTYAISVYAFGDVTIKKNTECRDNPAGMSPLFALSDVTCAQTTDAEPKYNNVKCTGSEWSAQVQENCKRTCGLCPGTSPAGTVPVPVPVPTSPAWTPCADSTTYTDGVYSLACSGWAEYPAGCTTDTANNCPVACGKCR